MRLANIIAGVIAIIISVVFYISSNQLPGFAVKLAGPDFFPKIVAILQAIVAIWLIKLNIIRWRSASPEGEVGRDNTRKVLLVILLTGIYYMILEIVGFWLDTFVYSILLSMLTQPQRRIIPAVITALCIICVKYLVFSVLLKAHPP